MYTKSLIQQTVESLRAKDNFRGAIEQLMEKYNIEDSVFVFKNGYLHEAVCGYFEVENEYDNLQQAIAECKDINMGIRVMQNEKFQIGNVRMNVFECGSDKKVFDLDRLEELN